MQKNHPLAPQKPHFLFLILAVVLLGAFWTWTARQTAGARVARYEQFPVFLPIVQGHPPQAPTVTPSPQPSATPTMTPSPTATLDPSITPTATPVPEAHCRYGVPGGINSYDVLPDLGVGWLLKFSSPYWTPAKPSNDAEKIHMIKTFQKKDGGTYLPEYYTNVPLDNELAAYIQKYPGLLWIIGNEVDRGPQPGQTVSGQGDMYPDIYAEAFHDVQAFIKANDPSARIGISGLVEVTPGRLQYLDLTWDSYMDKYGEPMPVDVWTMHVYILSEVDKDGNPNGIANVAVGTDPALGKRGSGGDPDVCSDPDVYCFAEHDDVSIFAEQIEDMRQWMKDHGQQRKPLIITEFSLLFPYEQDGNSCYIQDEFGNCFTPERVKNYMDATLLYLENTKNAALGYALDDDRLVQQWLWFSLYSSGIGDVSNLTEEDQRTLTDLGVNFRNHIQSKPLVKNLIIDTVPTAQASVGGEVTATADISVVFRNNGTTAVYAPFKVTFYRNAARTQVIDSITVNPELRGCTTDWETATVQWPGLSPGQHQFWVHVDSEDAIPETPPGQEDNVGTGFVQVN